MGSVSALSLFFAVLIHELAHAVVAKRRGPDVPRITLFIFGGVSHLSRQPGSPGEEFAIAIAGPVTSVFIAVFAGLMCLAVSGHQEQLEALFAYLALVNTLIAIFNLLPGFPLDGCRVFRSIAWRRSQSFRKATRTAGGAGEFFGWALVLIGVFTLFASVWNGIWFMFVGWFLANAARAEVQNVKLDTILAKLTAGDVMHVGYAKTTPGLDLQSAVDTYVLGQKRINQIPVIEKGRLIGLVSRRELVDRIQLTEEFAADGDVEGEE